MTLRPNSIESVEEYVAAQFRMRRIPGDPKALAAAVWEKGEAMGWNLSCKTWGSYADGFVGRHAADMRDKPRDAGKGEGESVYVCGLCWHPRRLPDYLKGSGRECECTTGVLGNCPTDHGRAAANACRMCVGPCGEATDHQKALWKALQQAIHFHRVWLPRGADINALYAEIGRVRARAQAGDKMKEYDERTGRWFALLGGTGTEVAE